MSASTISTLRLPGNLFALMQRRALACQAVLRRAFVDERTDYLARSTDLVDLERRQRAWEEHAHRTTWPVR